MYRTLRRIFCKLTKMMYNYVIVESISLLVVSVIVLCKEQNKICLYYMYSYLHVCIFKYGAAKK